MSRYNSFEEFFNDKFNKLNKYLNVICNELEKKDEFLLKYSFLIDCWCRSIRRELKDNFNYELYDKESSLTFMEVYSIARVIIEDINPKYLNEFDKILDNGILNFDYEKNNGSSSFIYDYAGNKYSININRRFNYMDIVKLIHEFFHYTNYSSNLSVNQNVLTEFISIYFETYAKNYLRRIGISDKDMNPYDRLDDLSRNYGMFKTYSKILTIFNFFGSFDNDSIDKYQKKIGYIDNYEIIEQSMVLLSLFENIEQVYYESYDRKYRIEERLSELFKDNYRYIIGTILSFYAIDNVNKESIVLLNDNINSKEVGNMDTFELLNMIGINVKDDNFIDKVVESIKNFAKENKKQR